MLTSAWQCLMYVNNHNSYKCIKYFAVTATLNCKHELFRVDHWCPLVLTLFPPLAVTPSFLALAPKVGAAVHTGYVEDGNPFQGDAAEVQSYTITLLERRKKQREKETNHISAMYRKLQFSLFWTMTGYSYCTKTEKNIWSHAHWRQQNVSPSYLNQTWTFLYS